MKKIYFYLYLTVMLYVGVARPQEREVKLKIVQTSVDVHGNYYPYNFIIQKEWGGSLARIYALVQKERETYKDNLILLE